MRVLGVGSGLGCPARSLASEIGCSVEVLDVPEEFCHADKVLTTRTGLGDIVSFRHANALNMPYPDGGFGLHLVLDADPGQVLENLARNLQEDQVAVYSRSVRATADTGSY